MSFSLNDTVWSRAAWKFNQYLMCDRRCLCQNTFIVNKWMYAIIYVALPFGKWAHNYRMHIRMVNEQSAEEMGRNDIRKMTCLVQQRQRKKSPGWNACSGAFECVRLETITALNNGYIFVRGTVCERKRGEEREREWMHPSIYEWIICC